MRAILSLLRISFLVFTACNMPVEYPVIDATGVTDTYFGTEIHDPFRILENDTSPETQQWLKAQNALTANCFKELEPVRQKIKNRLHQLAAQPEYWLPQYKAGKYFYYYKDSSLSKRVFCFSDQPCKNPRVLVNPQELFTNKNKRIAGGIRISDDGKYLAFKTSEGGSDWNRIHVMDIESRQLLPDLLNKVKYSDITWFQNGFYYSRYDDVNPAFSGNSVLENHRVYYHRIGEKQEADKLVYENQQQALNTFYTSMWNEYKYLFIHEEDEKGRESLLFSRLNSITPEFTRLTPFDDFHYSYTGMLDGEILLRINRGAPNYKLVSINPNKPSPENWKVILPETQNLLRSVSVIGEKLVALYMVDVCAEMKVFDRNGHFIHEVPLPSMGWTDGCVAAGGDSVAMFSFSSYAYPYVNYWYNIETNRVKVINKSVPGSFNPEEYHTRQVFYESHDGTDIPMFITCKRNLPLNGNNPAYITAYGGFNISQTPHFKSSIVPFLEQGGIYAVPNIRGGGEYGAKWHEEGTRFQKQNVFNDFVAAAECLVQNDYTNPEKLAIAGKSNGGLLIGAVITQRPDLFKVAIPSMGVMDMLRYHNFTIGSTWASDYGTSEENKAMFKYLLDYSPYHNISPGTDYPVTLIVTGDHDDRVVPAHSYKFTAALQSSGSNNPALLYVMENKGHAARMPAGDRWAFVMKHLGME